MGSITRTLVVNAPIERVFNFWRDFENFPRFMENVESISSIGEDLTHWKIKGPLGKVVEWDARTTGIEANQSISWQSVGGEIETHGSVTFNAESEAVTRVTIGLEYSLPGGVLGEAVARMFSNPEEQLDFELARFKRATELVGA